MVVGLLRLAVVRLGAQATQRGADRGFPPPGGGMMVAKRFNAHMGTHKNMHCGTVSFFPAPARALNRPLTIIS